MEVSEGIFVSLNSDNNGAKLIADRLAGDKVDGFRFSGLKINRGRRWKTWHVPATVLRLERLGRPVNGHKVRKQGKRH